MSSHLADPGNHYVSLKARMERTMDNLSAAKGHVSEYRPNVSPLR